MEKELNIAEILKDKPKGLKLWSDTFGELIVDCIDEQNDAFPIYLTVRCGNNICLTKDGCYYSDEAGTLPCIVPSKSMRDWSKFAWKKGDVLEYTEGEEPYYAIFEAFQDNEYTAFKSRYNFGGGNHWLQFNSQSSTNHFTKVSDEEAKAFIEKVEVHYGGKLNLETLEIEKPQFKPMDLCLMSDSFDDSLWNLCQFAFKDNDGFYHSVNGGIWRDCIPYNDQTAHLLGTNGDYEEGGE